MFTPSTARLLGVLLLFACTIVPASAATLCTRGYEVNASMRNADNTITAGIVTVFSGTAENPEEDHLTIIPEALNTSIMRKVMGLVPTPHTDEALLCHSDTLTLEPELSTAETCTAITATDVRGFFLLCIVPVDTFIPFDAPTSEQLDEPPPTAPL